MFRHAVLYSGLRSSLLLVRLLNNRVRTAIDVEQWQ